MKRRNFPKSILDYEAVNLNKRRSQAMHPTDRSTVVLVSGGIDSACCIDLLRSEDRKLHAIFFDYGQPAIHAEYSAAKAIADFYEVTLQSLSISPINNLGKGELVGRNAAFVFSALMATADLAPRGIVVGVHYGTPYYDCSEQFIELCGVIVRNSTGGVTNLIVPFATWQKYDIFEYAKRRKVPIELTHSCESGDHPCGHCASCKDREAFYVR